MFPFTLLYFIRLILLDEGFFRELREGGNTMDETLAIALRGREERVRTTALQEQIAAQSDQLSALHEQEQPGTT